MFVRNLMQGENNDPEFKFEFRGEIPMKGKPKPIKMWLLSRSQINIKIINFDDLKGPFSDI